MYLTNINRLIWIIVSLSSYIRAQQTEFVFNGEIYYNITDYQDIKLICTADLNIVATIYVRDDKAEFSTLIVDEFELRDQFIGKYNYTITSIDSNTVQHELVVGKIHKDGGTYKYQCYAYPRNGLIGLTVYYPPKGPTCISAKENKTSAVTTLTCRSDPGKPTTSMAIYNSTNTYTPTSIESDDTHISQSVDFYGYGENIKCTTTYNFIQKGMVYTTNQSCMFNNIVKPVYITSGSTIPKYSILTLAMVILSRSI